MPRKKKLTEDQKQRRELLYEKKARVSATAKYKGECQPLETGDMTASLNLITMSIKRYKGVGWQYPATPEGLQLFVERSQEFFDYVNEVNSDPKLEKKLIPDIESWSVYLGSTRQAIFTYAARGGAWAEAIDFFKNAINTAKKQLAMTYKIPSTIYIFDSVNNHNYHNVSEFHVAQTTTVLSEQSALEREIISSGLAWNDESGDFDIVDTKGEFVEDVDIRPDGESNQGNSEAEGGES